MACLRDWWKAVVVRGVSEKWSATGCGERSALCSTGGNGADDRVTASFRNMACEDGLLFML